MRSAVWAAGLALACVPLAAAAADGEKITVTGEAIDTWCYYSGVMGSAEATLGSAHHTCAMWCSAGGIPVGLRADDGTVYMVLQIGDDATSNGGDAQFQYASDTITAEGTHFVRDDIHYLVIDKVIDDVGITTQTHLDYGIVPGFAIPEPK